MIARAMNLRLPLKICVASTHGKPTHTKQQRLHTFQCSKSEFDVWKPYTKKDDFDKFNNYTLFIVRACQGNVFFNKKK